LTELDVGANGGGLGEAFSHDIIVELSRRRWLTMIARGSTFQFQSDTADLANIGQVLNVGYVLTGSFHMDDGRIRITVELAESDSGRILWADGFEQPYSEIFVVRRAVSEAVAASVSQEIEFAEVNRARDLEPADLGAWAAFHRGLWHAFRFNRKDNETARQLFLKAVGDDPAFSGAFAALSFTHFQRAFLQYSDNLDGEIDSALAFAEKSLDLDPRNPRGHYAYGRACMLGRKPDACIEALETSLLLEPSFAQGFYTLGLVQSQAGDPEEAIRNLDRASELSPVDPLQFAMIMTRTLCQIRLGRFDEAASTALRGVAKPHAHTQAFATAAIACTLAGRDAEAGSFAAEVRRRHIGYSAPNYFAAFPNFSARDRETLLRPLTALGFA
jgi:TolB-like protein/Tfp pilus assembly protein PilF